MTRIHVSLLCAAGALALGCATEGTLTPGPGAQLLPGSDTTAFAERAGVQVQVDGAAWRGEPGELARLLTPVNVAIDNRSGRKLRIAYRDFSLVGASGFRYPAMAPLPGQMAVSAADAPQGTVVLAQHPARPAPRRAPPPPRFRHRHFYVAPHVRPWYPGFHVWPHFFFFDADAYRRSNWPAALPTDDMISLGLPEGVLEDGGHVEGFVYFQGVARREAQVHFELQLVEAETEQALGVMVVPFSVRGGP